ncbi:hypothetical protein [Bradyrhizobium neotropicale]|uniref:hypothetical protein n=1 Tax=Bradyrhizobium neotropicale TaxID=1497615 RepID=UPI001AD7A194|nr:hypothetical protein [Bradyrhizobium neotropicale]MBO4226472.1 hypothetical protein [Bradyrhizobium neotropicale]
MGWDNARITLLLGLAATLAGCGFVDSRSPLPMPAFLRAREAEPPPLEAPPDIKRLVSEKLDSVFVSTSRPANVRVSQPLHDPRGLGWTACVRAELTSVMGQPLGTQTYRVVINEGAIADRRRSDSDDICATENYEPI